MNNTRHRFVSGEVNSCLTKKLSDSMKKLMLTIASLLFVSVMAVNAQVQDTTSAGQPSTGYQEELNYDDMDAVPSSDVPASLRSSLQGSEYSGWEEGKVYRHKNSNEYIVVIGDENAKVFRFDSNGQRLEDMDSQSGSDKTAPESETTPPPSGTTPSGSTTPSGTTPETTPAPAK
jgi:hypothetical protein